MKNKLDRYQVVRRFLYGRDAIKQGVNREALVLSAFKGDTSFPFCKQLLEDSIAYLRCQYKLDPYYTKDREAFFNS
jgi:hypothetical protein